jgi:hypothetical protein
MSTDETASACDDDMILVWHCCSGRLFCSYKCSASVKQGAGLR